jgi:arylsulfatase A-like enzyme
MMGSKKALPEGTLTLAEFLRQNGYSTAITGKWHLGLSFEGGPMNYGFEYAYGYLHGQIDQYTHHYKTGEQSWYRGNQFIEEAGHATDLITDEAIKFIRELRDKSKPFFLYIPYSVPHYPHQEEEKWVKPYKKIINKKSRQIFAGAMTHMDASIGRILKVLEEVEQRKNTLIIFLSDNGGELSWAPKFEYNMKHGPYEKMGDNKPLRGAKKSLYEGGIRVPAVVNWPGQIDPKKIDHSIHVTDLLPTIAGMLEKKVPEEARIDGKNVWQSITNNNPVAERPLYWRVPRQLGIIKGKWKLIHKSPDLDTGAFELYDILADCAETKDISSQYPEIVKILREELNNQMDLDSSH